MAFKSDYLDSLKTEVLSDMAENFFGVRKKLENGMDLLNRYIDILNDKADRVESKIRFFNALFINESNVRKFYVAVHIDINHKIISGRVDNDALPTFIKPAFTLKGKYSKLVAWAYDEMQRACEDYLVGHEKAHYGSQGTSNSEVVSLGLIRGLCQVLNEEIVHVNKEVQPSGLLSYVKCFDPIKVEKEKLTGGGSGLADECRLNRKMAYDKIDFDGFNLRNFPLFPKRQRIDKQLNTSIQLIFKKEYKQISSLIDALKIKCNG